MPQYLKRIGNSSSGWREIGGQKYYFRSRWEANYARYLQFLKRENKIQSWLYEPYTFWFNEIKRGVRSYKPDFKVFEFDGSHCWHEVKGFYDSKSMTKIKRLIKYYPDEKILLIDSKWFMKNKNISKVISGWEHGGCNICSCNGYRSS